MYENIAAARIRQPLARSWLIATGMLCLAAEHHERAQPLRIAERHAGHVEDHPGRGVAAEDLIDGGRQALDRGHVDLADERHHRLGRGAAHGDGKIRSIHPHSLTWISA